jgi:hypothetical protein
MLPNTVHWVHRDTEGIIGAHQNNASTRIASMPLYVRNPDGAAGGMLKRQCTDEYKVGPSNRTIKEELAKRGLATVSKGWQWDPFFQRWDDAWWVEEEAPRFYPSRDIYVESWFGMSTDELRRTDPYRGPYWMKARYPLVELRMSRDDCVNWLKANGFKVPLKSSCKQCPYRSDEAWLWIPMNAPDVFEETCQFDDLLRTPAFRRSRNFRHIRGTLYLHRSRIPLREVGFQALIAGRRRGEISMWDMELIDGKTCATDGGFSCMS